MKAVLTVIMLLLTELLFTACVSIPNEDADERPWNNTAGGWQQDRDER